MAELEVEFLDDFAKKQFHALPNMNLKREALRKLGKLKNENPWAGKPCGYAPSTGNIGDCRKMYFDESEDVEARYRIVYRLLPDEEKPMVIEVIRIDLKVPEADGEYIYTQVGRALGRLPRK